MVTAGEVTEPMRLPVPRAWWWPWLLTLVTVIGVAGWGLCLIVFTVLTGCY